MNVRLLALSILLCAPSLSAAQGTHLAQFSAAVQGLVSVQSVDDSYVGGLYLDRGLGGVAPGVSIGLDVTAHRFALAVEYSTTSTIEVIQTGRLVSGTGAAQLRDSLFSVLGGGSVWTSATSSVVALAGFGVRFGEPAQGGVPLVAYDDPAAHEGNRRAVFTVGVNGTHRVARRAGFVASARYSHLDRSRRAEELGVGAHVIRLGAGVRILLTP